MGARLLIQYRKRRKAVRGALVTIVPVLVLADAANLSVYATALSVLAGVLGVGGVVHQAENVD